MPRQGHEVTISGSSNAQEQVCGSECRETHEQVVAKDYPRGAGEMRRLFEDCADTASQYIEVEAQSPWGRDLMQLSKQNEHVNSEKSCLVTCADTLSEVSILHRHDCTF